VKKFFQIIGITSLACFSFIFTEKTANTLRDNDNLMKVIKEESNLYKVESENARLDNDTIIPGINGKIVNNNRSYDNMKRFGAFNENMLIYDVILPEMSIKNTYNKYVVSGNPRKNSVSIIVKVSIEDNVKQILSVVDKNIPLNFFIDGKWMEKNEEEFKILTSNNYNIGNLSYGGNYLDSSFVWLKTIINKYSNQNNSYCYLEQKNDEFLDMCALHKSYTLFPSIIIGEYPLITLKEKLKSGDIISLEITQTTLKELPLMISYIKSKGYKIVSLDELLSEDM